MKHRITPLNGLLAFLIVASGLLVRIYLGTDSGYESDLQQYLSWAIEGSKHPFHKVYAAGVGCNYPPLTTLIFWLLGKLHHASQSHFLESDLKFLIIKLPAIFADLLTTLAIYSLVLRTHSARIASVMAALFVFNPAVFGDSTIWGQTDGWVALFPLLALGRLHRGNFMWVGALLSLGLAVKPQAMILCLAILVCAVVRAKPWQIARLSAGLTLAYGAVCLPFIIGGTLGDVFHYGYVSNFDRHRDVTAGALNFWFATDPISRFDLASAGRFLSRTLTFKDIGLILFGLTATLVTAIASVSHSLPQQAFSIGMVAVTFYFFPTQIHERYLMPAVPFLAVAAAESAGLMAVYLIISMWAYFSCYPSGQIIGLMKVGLLPAFSVFLVSWWLRMRDEEPLNTFTPGTILQKIFSSIPLFLYRHGGRFVAALIALYFISAAWVGGYFWTFRERIPLSSLSPSASNNASWGACPASAEPSRYCKENLLLTGESVAEFYIPRTFSRFRADIVPPPDSIGNTHQAPPCGFSLRIFLNNSEVFAYNPGASTGPTTEVDIPLASSATSKKLTIKSAVSGHCTQGTCASLIAPRLLSWTALAREPDVQEIFASEVYTLPHLFDHGIFSRDQHHDGQPLQIAHSTYRHGFATHADSRMTLPIPHGFQEFQTDIGFDSLVSCPDADIRFSILVDGLERYRSTILKPGEIISNVTVSLDGARTMTLSVDSVSVVACDHAIWGNARFIRP